MEKNKGNNVHEEYGLGYPKAQILPGKTKTFNNLPDNNYPDYLKIEKVQV